MLGEHKELIDRINRLKKEKNAVILVHNYQRPEIYEVADYIEDSLGLSRKAAETKARIIVFCGVDFMAESAKILNPEKKVLHPDRTAKCPMAAAITGEKLREFKKKHPGVPVVAYVNTTADVKAESDIGCTSANAIEIVNSLPDKTVIMVPDKYLAAYVQLHTDKKVIPWEGHCYVHKDISAEQLKIAKEMHPDAKVVAHPECRPEVLKEADFVASTSQMEKVVRENPAKEFIIATELGMIEKLKRIAPEKIFYAAPLAGICLNMKKVTLQNVYETLKDERNEVTVPEDVRVKAKKSLDRMLKVK